MPAGTAEDGCLNLNIFTPPVEKISKQGLPVMVFIHGGSYREGANSQPIVNGKNFITYKPEVILVVINYRLNIFGYLGSKELLEEAGDASIGNWGHEDQVAALHWVKDNISAFGGDPKNITAFGESAGSCSVHYLSMLYNTDPENPLFHKAIMESGTSGTLPCATITEAQPVFNRLLELCEIEKSLSAKEKIAALRKVSDTKLGEFADQLKKERFAFQPILDTRLVKTDGRLLQHSANDSANGGKPKYLPVPTIFGCNRDEGTIFAKLFPPDAALDGLLAHLYPAPWTDRVKELYQPAHYRSKLRLQAALFGDSIFVQPVLEALRHTRDYYGSNAEVYGYRFACPAQKSTEDKNVDWNRPLPSSEANFGSAAGTDPSQEEGGEVGIFHAQELAYVFYHDDVKVNKREIAVAEAMIDRWTEFAKTGKPGGGWVPFGSQQQVYVFDGKDISTPAGMKSYEADGGDSEGGPELRKKRYAFWTEYWNAKIAERVKGLSKGDEAITDAMTGSTE